jgi:hypothetical protein
MAFTTSPREILHVIQVPLVPLVPYLSVCMNVYLMVQLDYLTWVRFIIWLIVGKCPTQESICTSYMIHHL